MELEFDVDKEFSPLIIGCYTVTTKGDDKLCLICHDTNSAYDKYKLTCKHTFHTRCYRRYCFYKDAIICPLCNEIKPFQNKLSELQLFF